MIKKIEFLLYKNYGFKEIIEKINEVIDTVNELKKESDYNNEINRRNRG